MKNTISVHSSVREALALLENLDIQTLFVVDEEGRVKGTLTDGDIRRGMLGGAVIDDPVSNVMQRNFKFLRRDKMDVQTIRAYRDKLIKIIPVLDEEGYIVDTVNLNKYRSRLPIDAVLMAGGRGERLRPLTEHTPKPLLPVGDKAIIDHNVDHIISYGVDNIRVSVHYLASQIEEHFAQPRDGVQVKCYRETEFLGTIGAVRQMPAFEHDAVLVMNSDLYTNIDLEDFYLHFKEKGADMSIAAILYNVSIPFGILDLDGCDVKGLMEKPVFNYYANSGIYLIRREMLEQIPQNSFCHATNLAQKLIEQGRKVIRYPLNGTWIDIGTLKEYQKACELATRE